jgi:5,10-methylenetetrahydromethanopterin reductase
MKAVEAGLLSADMLKRAESSVYAAPVAIGSGVMQTMGIVVVTARKSRTMRSLGEFPVVFVVTLGLGSDADVGTRWVRSWFAPGQPFLAHPSASNLHWLRARFELEDSHAALPENQAGQIADAFGLFGPPERCADRLLRAREEAGVERVFLFPAHDLNRGYDMPEV